MIILLRKSIKNGLTCKDKHVTNIKNFVAITSILIYLFIQFIYMKKVG